MSTLVDIKTTKLSDGRINCVGYTKENQEIPLGEFCHWQTFQLLYEFIIESWENRATVPDVFKKMFEE